MRRVTRISRLRRCGVFRNFAWPSDLLEFGQYNLIYGWNGTGKTTLSRLFRGLELRQPPTLGEVVLRIDDTDIRGDDFPQSNLQIRVFNRDFIQENVFPVGGRDMPPILVLGAENVEKQKQVELLRRQKDTAQSNLDSARATEQAALAEFDRFCIDRARFVKDTLRSSGSNNPYNNFNKAGFQRDAEKASAAGDSTKHLLTDANREGLLALHRAPPKPKVAELAYALPDFKAILGRVSKLLTTTITSAAIEGLKSDPPLAEWTFRGLELHRHRDAERCLFCEQPMPLERLADLEAHFSAQYEQFMQRIDQEMNGLKAASSAAAKLRLPTKTDIYDDLAHEFQSLEVGLTEALASAQDFLAHAVQALDDKKRRAFEQVKLDFRVPPVDAGAVGRLNAVIGKHNQVCDEFETRIEEARQRLATDTIAAELDEFVRRRDGADRAKDNVQTSAQEVQRLDVEIAALEREIVEHRQPAEELNEDLKSYLGHQELCLEIRETGYMISRGGVPAQPLSEGETTAIALLYFLKSLKDRRFTVANGVIVLDDPVSSLDANALFLAFGFIQERTKDAGQLFVLTHNFTFFRQVRNWFHHLRGQKRKDVSQRPARFFMLESGMDESSRSSTIRWLDPLLEQYASEYQYLFACIHRASTELGSSGLAQNYTLPNIARRMLEAFLAFRQPQVSGQLWQKLQAVSFDEAKKLRILRFLHTHSHSIAVGEPEHDLTALAEGPAVLKDLLEMIQSLDDAHFSAMVELVARPSDFEVAGDEVAKS